MTGLALLGPALKEMKDRIVAGRSVLQRACAAVKGDIVLFLPWRGQTPRPVADDATLKGKGDKECIFGRFLRSFGLTRFQLTQFGVDAFHITKEVAHAVAIVKSTI